jgi:transcriptional regulator with XRE-family HTH domain
VSAPADAEEVEVMSSRNPVDKQVGDRLRIQRLSLGLSREQVAVAVGSTARQVEQWEAGTDRIGATSLQRLASVLAVDSTYFFANGHAYALNGEAGAKDRPTLQPNLGADASLDEVRLVHAFGNIRNRALRDVVIKLVKTMADAEGGEGFEKN